MAGISKEVMGRRAVARVCVEVDALVLVRFSPEGKVDPEGVVISKTSDVSTDGMRININQMLIIGTLLQVYLFEKDSDQKYMVTGEVVWCQESAEGGFCAGFSLLDTDSTDLAAWREYLSERLEGGSGELNGEA